MQSDSYYKETSDDRDKYTQQIVDSTANKRIVVAGPGTGKTHLFKKILGGKSKTLTLTFVNSLVDDLSLELNGISDVKTLHSFARGVLRKTGRDIKIYDKLSKIIREDALILLKVNVNFDELFYERNDQSEYIDFYKKRHDYYGYYGYTDVVFAAAKYLEENVDKIPKYEQVVVDEFQDFNKLEVSLIDLLASVSKTVIAGDDDQAIYDFKKADPAHIRDKYGDKFPEYEPYTLPYCSRSTSVVVAATNDVISMAQKSGFLAGRIPKEYKYFEEAKKDKDSEKYPVIYHQTTYARMIAWVLAGHISEIAKDLRETFTVLVITPTNKQAQSLANALRKKGFSNIDYKDKSKDDLPTITDGYKILLEDETNNLGWRIIAGALLDKVTFEKLLISTLGESPKNIIHLMDPTLVNLVKNNLKIIKKIIDDKTPSNADIENIVQNLSFDSRAVVLQELKSQLIATNISSGDPATRRIPIKITTIQSSKGLAAEFVFFTYFDDQYLLDGKTKKVSDKTISNIIVAMTRARKCLYLISSSSTEPTFLCWINKAKVKTL